MRLLCRNKRWIAFFLTLAVTAGLAPLQAFGECFTPAPNTATSVAQKESKKKTPSEHFPIDQEENVPEPVKPLEPGEKSPDPEGKFFFDFIPLVPGKCAIPGIPTSRRSCQFAGLVSHLPLYLVKQTLLL